MTASRIVRIGVIGAGRIGVLHAEYLQLRIDETRVVGIAEPRLEEARALGERLGVAAIHGDHRELLSDPGVDAVAICSSTDTHAAIIEEAAAAGKHIFCEKPIDQDIRRVDRALEAVDRAGVKLQVGFNRRFDANFSRVREIIERGEIGEVHLLRISSRDPAPPPPSFIETSGGMFLDMTIHDFDMARCLIGSEVEEVSVVAGVLVDPAIGEAGDVDTAITTLRFANGAIGAIDNSRQAVYGYDQRVEVLGSRGMVQADNNAEDQSVLWNADGVRRARPLHFFLERYSESFVAELRAFARSVLDDTTPPVTGADARIPILIAMAAQKSHQEHRPVRLSEVEG
jgi:myo-inositol 2-dehydrogenase/D-chiro-inositol 1-dehydrogenase